MMRESIGKSGISDEALAAYFDGEASETEASAIRQVIENDPELAAELEQLGVMAELTAASLQDAAADVPQARFEQIWDQIDRAIEEDERKAIPTAPPAGLWDRLKAAFAPVKWPVAAAAAAAVVTVFVMRTGGDEAGSEPMADRGANKAPGISSMPETADEDGSKRDNAPTPPKVSPAPDNRLAERMPAPEPTVTQPLAPVPEDSRVELHEIEGSGNDVRISNGTVTVLYVEEEIEDGSSERSL